MKDVSFKQIKENRVGYYRLGALINPSKVEFLPSAGPLFCKLSARKNFCGTWLERVTDSTKNVENITKLQEITIPTKVLHYELFPRGRLPGKPSARKFPPVKSGLPRGSLQLLLARTGGPRPICTVHMAICSPSTRHEGCFG